MGTTGADGGRHPAGSSPPGGAGECDRDHPRGRFDNGPSLTGKQVLQALVGLALAVVLLVWGLPYFGKTSWREVYDVLRTIPWPSLVLFQGLMLAGLYSYTFTLTGSLPGLSHKKALILNLCGSSVSNLLPAGGAVGLAATYTISRSWGFTNRATSTSAIVTGVWNVLARIVLPTVAILALWFGATDTPVALRDAALAGAASGLFIIGVFVALLASERVAQVLGHGLDKVLRPVLGRSRRTRTMSIDTLVHDMRARTGAVVRDGWVAMTLGMIGFFGLYYVLFVLIMRTTGLTQPLGILFAAFAISRLLTAVGITPGGVGVSETGTVAALVAWGAPPAGAAAGVVLFSVFTHLMEIPLGGIGWILWSLSPKSTRPPEGSEPPPDPA